jgi:cytokinin dehydrogenase
MWPWTDVVREGKMMTASTDTSWQLPDVMAGFPRDELCGHLGPGDDRHDRDQGGLLRSPALAVLTPACVEDIAVTVTWCNDHGIQAVPRGTGHMTGGQSLGGPGVVQIDMRELAEIHSISDSVIDVDAGVLWRDVVDRAWERHLRVRSGLTGYLGLTVGGTLSAGGISAMVRTGAQVDDVLDVQVVTGAGEVIWASLERDRDLFLAVLGGLGQVAIITRVRLQLVPAPQRVQTVQVHYPLGRFAELREDMRIAALRGTTVELLAMIRPEHDSDTGPVPGTAVLRISHYYNTVVPTTQAMLDGLSVAGTKLDELDDSYRQFVDTYDHVIDGYEEFHDFGDRHKPWADFFLTSDGLAAVTDEIVPTLTHHDRGHFGWILLFAKRRSSFVGPLPALPEPDHESDGLVWLLDLLTVSDEVPPAQEWDEAMAARNRHLWGLVRDHGGRVYPIGAIGVDDWTAHFGSYATRYRAAQQLYDPRAALKAAGPGRL